MVIERLARVPKILVVDDSPVSRRLMELLLLDLGHEVVLASTGMEALSAIQREHFQFAFIDLQMPDMNGYQTVRAIREELGEHAPTTVACSATAKNDLECKDAGFVFVITKPVTRESLIKVLKGEDPTVRAPQESSLTWAIPEGLALLTQFAGRERVADLLQLFVTESERRIGVLLRALKDRNMDLFARSAHSIHGTAAQMGAQKLAAISSELENEALTGERIRLTKLTTLMREFELVRAEISDFLTK